MNPLGKEPAFTVLYKGQQLHFYELPGQGYCYKCPAGCCSAWHWIETASGSRHKITSPPGTPATIVASLACRCYKGCTWHVHITNGVARDA